MRRFDRYVIVDWSASATPKSGADSIWIADHAGDGVALHNPDTRHAAERLLGRILDDAADERTLVGVDASLGYPTGTADLLGLTGEPWSAMWQVVTARLTDDDRNRNNRFAVASTLNAQAGPSPGPFWGTPASQATDHLTATKVRSPDVSEFRECEQRLRDLGRSPASGWQLLGAGSVGSQTLTVLPVLQRLREWRSGVHVWPFTTGLTAPSIEPGGVVMCEVWPTAFDPVVPIGMVRDAAQVAAVAQAISEADDQGRLGRWFTPQIAPELRADVEREEGWVLTPLDLVG